MEDNKDVKVIKALFNTDEIDNAALGYVPRCKWI